MIKIKIKEKMFGGSLLLIIGDEEKYTDFVNKEYYRGHGQIEPDYSTLGEFRRIEDTKENTKKTKNIIWIPTFEGRKEDWNVLTHELMHFTFRELNRRGIRSIYGEYEIWDEEFAYFYGKIFSEVKIKLDEYTKTTSKANKNIKKS